MKRMSTSNFHLQGPMDVSEPEAATREEGVATDPWTDLAVPPEFPIPAGLKTLWSEELTGHFHKGKLLFVFLTIPGKSTLPWMEPTALEAGCRVEGYLRALANSSKPELLEQLDPGALRERIRSWLLLHRPSAQVAHHLLDTLHLYERRPVRITPVVHSRFSDKPGAMVRLTNTLLAKGVSLNEVAALVEGHADGTPRNVG